MTHENTIAVWKAGTPDGDRVWQWISYRRER